MKKLVSVILVLSMTAGLIAGCGNKMPTPKIAEDTKEDDVDKKESKEDTSKAASSSDSEGVNWLLACYTSGDNVIKYNDFAKFGVEDIAALSYIHSNT